MTESQTTTTNNATPSSAAPAATGAAALPPTPVDPTGTTAAAAAPAKDPATQTINMRCLIVTQDASIIIGKGGKHVNEIRVSMSLLLVSNLTFSYKCLSAGLQEKSSARVNISESIPGNPERILSVQGPLDAVSKVRVWHKSSSISYTDTPSAYPPPSSRHLVSSSDESTMNRLINPLSLVLEPSRSSSSSPTLGWVACAFVISGQLT
jgi:hypothetical protein